MKLRAGTPFAALLVAASAALAEVRVWETNLVIPTYLAAPPSAVPRFYDGRTYQGAKATFYPYPVQDVLTDVKTNVTYRALFLENEYLQISVLPQLGGRIWSALDQSNGYDFFYRQHVVKPALIGMLGAWVSGGVEWNVPHHHRATSFSPVDCTTQPHADGSATIWVGEIERRHRMKWLVGLTLHPGRSDLELTCKLFNRTPLPHPMLFWINAAVHANENYQVLFPPATEWAAQHGKPEFASWPIARQVYGGTDYTRGVDVSWWKNHPNPVSFFCWDSADDWFGGYDHGRQAGVVHVADHQVVPGKKFFEWGNGPEGEMWSNILTDEDGPYLELMAGAWSDNQPDYSWIQPGETREWKHWWYPIQKLGGVKAANRDVALNLDVTNRVAKIGVNTTALFTNVEVTLMYRNTDFWGFTTNIGPARPFSAEVELGSEVEPSEVGLSVWQRSPSPASDLATDKPLLLAYSPQRPRQSPKPAPVERPKAPQDYATADDLYFTGQRIEQLYSPSFEARPYYEEILRRDPGDYRANTALGILLCQQWRWAEAAARLSNALARASANYIRPKDGEASFYLGVALHGRAGEIDRFAGERRPDWETDLDAAATAFRQAAWSEAWKGASFHQLAEIECLRGQLDRALAAIDQSLASGARNTKALNLRAAILRRQQRSDDAARCAAEALAIDPLDGQARFEELLATRFHQQPAADLRAAPEIRHWAQSLSPTEALETVADYARVGFYDDAETVILALRPDPAVNVPARSSLDEPVFNAWGQFANPFQIPAAKPDRLGHLKVFPFQSESAGILKHQARRNDSPVAPYLLGCLLYDNQPENAIQAWEESRTRDDTIALTHRNLGLAYAQHERDLSKAIASLERAIALDPSEPRFFYELDVQYEANGTPVDQRLQTLVTHHSVVARRDDALTREIVLLTVTGQADRALELLRKRRFHNWEGSGQIQNVYVDACLARGQQLLAEQKPRAALATFESAREYPENLEVGRARRSPRTAQIQFLIGTAQVALGETGASRAAFEQAAGSRGGAGSETDFYRGLALRKLGRGDEAQRIFERLVKDGAEQFAKGAAPDYFAKFGERQSERVRQANALFLTGLGRLGLGDGDGAQAKFQECLAHHPAHVGTSLALALMPTLAP